MRYAPRRETKPAWHTEQVPSDLVMNRPPEGALGTFATAGPY